MRPERIMMAALLLGACQPADTPVTEAARMATESNVARTEIEATTAKLYASFNAGALDSAASAFTEDYVWLAPNQRADSGRANWVRMNTALLAMAKFNGSVTIEAVVANGPLAVLRGRYVSTITPGPAAPKGAKTVADTGKIHWQWRKVDGHWLLAVASWNSDLPAGR